MNSKEACAAHFKGQPGFRRIFDVMRKKWESYGEVRGRVNLVHASQEEKAAISGLLGKKQSGGSVSFSLEEFAAALRETRFSDVSLEELLEGYYGEELVSSRDRKLQKKKAEEEFWEESRRLLEQSGCEEALKWLSDMQTRQEFGYALVMAEYRREVQMASKALCQVGELLKRSEMVCHRGEKARLEETAYPMADSQKIGGIREKPGIRLALLAMEVTGNPHALDRQTTLGNLFTAALCWRTAGSQPSNAEQWNALYEENGVLTDDLSSQVVAYGVHLEMERGLHPAYEAFIREKEPYVLMLANLSKISRAFGDSRDIFIVENEMVFSELLERVKDIADVSLLCTSGQLRIAAYVLLDLLAKEECRFYYAGDIDPEGLGIAQRIFERYPGKVSVWRMSSSDYEKSISDVKLAKRSLEKLKNITHPGLVKTAEAIQKEGVAGYQEKLVDVMARDILCRERSEVS